MTVLALELEQGLKHACTQSTLVFNFWHCMLPQTSLNATLKASNTTRCDSETLKYHSDNQLIQHHRLWALSHSHVVTVNNKLDGLALKSLRAVPGFSEHDLRAPQNDSSSSFLIYISHFFLLFNYSWCTSWIIVPDFNGNVSSILLNRMKLNCGHKIFRNLPSTLIFLKCFQTQEYMMNLSNVFFSFILYVITSFKFDHFAHLIIIEIFTLLFWGIQCLSDGGTVFFNCASEFYY